VLALEMVIQKKGIRKKKRERGAMLSFLFEILLHMLESHCWHLIKVFSVNSQNFITNTIYFLNIFITPKRNPVPISCLSSLPSSGLWQPNPDSFNSTGAALLASVVVGGGVHLHSCFFSRFTFFVSGFPFQSLQ
jgi:hypothetical protein